VALLSPFEDVNAHDAVRRLDFPINAMTRCCAVVVVDEAGES
jgi:hypothetical protein